MTDPVQLAVGVDGHASAWRVPRRPGWTTCDAHPMSDALVPGGYGDLLAEITSEVRVARLRAARTVNSELLALYWRIGRLILIRQESEPWGSGVIKRLANDLRREFPDMKGLSPTNLQYMRAFAAAWPGTDPISQRVVLGTHRPCTTTRIRD